MSTARHITCLRTSVSAYTPSGETELKIFEAIEGLEIGHGSFGSVIKVHMVQDNEVLALKTVLHDTRVQVRVPHDLLHVTP
jgi:hypothetical protein